MLYVAGFVLLVAGFGLGYKVRQSWYEVIVSTQHMEIQMLTEELSELREIQPESPVNRMV